MWEIYNVWLMSFILWCKGQEDAVLCVTSDIKLYIFTYKQRAPFAPADNVSYIPGLIK